MRLVQPSVFLLALGLSSCSAELGDEPLRISRQAHVDCALPDGSGNPPAGDADEDGFCDDEDTCPEIANDQSLDADGDGVGDRCDPCFGDAALGDADDDGFCADEDCDDRDKDTYPGAEELCDGRANACGAALPESERDTDGDGVPECRDRCLGADGFGDSDADGICNDIDPCDGDNATDDVDDDGVCGDRDVCDGDDAVGDSDADGVCDDRDRCDGDDATGDIDQDGFCDDLDCDDLSDSVYPGAPETCDGVDESCDGARDEGAECPPDQACAAGACTPLTPCFADADGDGYGDADAVSLFDPGTDCDALGLVANGADCDDDPSACGAGCAPGAVERCDAVDHDCSGRPNNEPDALCEDPEFGVAICVAARCEVTCDAGYLLDGERCVDADECDTAPCVSPAQCVNVPGSFYCECPRGTVATDDDVSRCESLCGDGVLFADESCDDANDAAEDGCHDCEIEPGWVCDADGCATVCGDGLIRGEERCDDANAAAGDGCEACAIVPPYRCIGQPSDCRLPPVCGNAQLEAGELCDDGNDVFGDGCSLGCAVEEGWQCSAQPGQVSVCQDFRLPDASSADVGDEDAAGRAPNRDDVTDRTASGCAVAAPPSLWWWTIVLMVRRRTRRAQTCD